MLYCFDSRLPFDCSQAEMAISKINGNGILYDNVLKIFMDFDGNEIDIHGEIIFPRTGVTQIYEMNNEIVNHGGIPIVTNDEIHQIENWPNYYETKRKTKVLKGSDLINLDVILKLELTYGEELFLKTTEKNFSSVIPLTLLKDSECAFYKALSHHLDEKFIVSEKVDVVEDKYGKKEYRCFVVNNQVYNISRFTTDVFHKIDNEVLEKANEIVKMLESNFPKCYVLDLFEYQVDDSICLDVVEINPIHSSGLFLYNSVMRIEKNNDILHSDLRKISREFIEKVDECSVDGSVINDRESLYEVCGSFAGDLRSICLTGNVGLAFSFYTNLSIKDFARHTKIYDFGNMEPISDEDLLMDDDTFFSELVSEGASSEMIDKLQKLLRLDEDS